MDTIKINPDGGTLSVNIKFQSMQAVSYSYRIFNIAESEVYHKETGDSEEAKELNTRLLPQKAKYYIDKKIRISIDLIDPIGAGNDYKITVQVMQDGAVCMDKIIFSGKSKKNDVYDVRWRKFTAE